MANERDAQGHMICPVCREVIRTPDLSPFVGGQRVHEKCWSSPFIELPAGEILAFDGHQWAPVWDGSQVLPGNLRPMWRNVQLPLLNDTFTLVEGILPAGVPLGRYIFYALVARAGTFAGDPANWLFCACRKVYGCRALAHRPVHRGSGRN
jgi:hypothetical protein